MDLKRTKSGLFRYLLGRFPWDRALERRGVQESQLILTESPPPSSGAVHADEQKVKQRWQEDGKRTPVKAHM